MRRAVARQMVGSVLGAVSSVLGSILVFIAAGKTLGPELFGTFALTYAIISLLGLIFDFGYPVSFLRNTRKPADNSPGELPKQALGLKVALFVVLTPFAVGVPFLTGTNLLVGMVLWVGLSLISLGNFYSTMLRAIGLHSKDAVNLFISNFAGLVIAGVAYFAWPEGLGVFLCVRHHRDCVLHSDHAAMDRAFFGCRAAGSSGRTSWSKCAIISCTCSMPWVVAASASLTSLFWVFSPHSKP